MSKRKRYTAEEKMKILRDILEDGKPISQVAEAYGFHLNNIHTWRKQLFEGGVQTFKINRADISWKAEERKINALAELAGELLELNKNILAIFGYNENEPSGKNDNRE